MHLAPFTYQFGRAPLLYPLLVCGLGWLCSAAHHSSLKSSLKVESLYDTGSQIVSISEEKAMEAGLSWDPDIVIYMQSANKGVEKSLGLARNVAFLFGDIVLYMQVHVIRNPAYDLLLGSPFDTLTESCVRTTKDGNKTITIHDPNTHKRAVVPTYARGRGPKILEKKLEQQKVKKEEAYL